MTILRPLTREDIPQMVAIEHAITKKKVSRTWTRMVERHLENPDSVGFVALRDGQVAGFVIGEIKGEGYGLRQSGWIEVVGVDPHAMGEGIGKAMIDKLFEAFRSRKVTNVYTAVRWDSVDMVSFFKSVGFGRSDFINLFRKL